jgi:7-cyano-7-deazaguanine synthase
MIVDNKLGRNKDAVVLLSGGLDSTTTLALAQQEGFKINALSFCYGQRHLIELRAAERVVISRSIQNHLIVDIDLRCLGGSALTDDMSVPKNRSMEQVRSQIPVTYVPARNTIFLSYALAWAEVLKAEDIFIGISAIDYSAYPDCRPAYLAAFESMAALATKASTEGRSRFQIHAPLMRFGKADIIRCGLTLGVDYSLTHSCYDPSLDGSACGECDSCRLRLKGFAEVGIPDPTRYKKDSILHIN